MDVDLAGRIGDALPAMLSVGVQVWGTNVAADDLGLHVQVARRPRD